MLLNKNLIPVIFISSIIFFSCKEKDEPVETANQYDNPEFVLKQSKDVIGENVKKTFKGNFVEDSVVQVVAGEEIENKDTWGIKFHLLKLVNNNLKIEDKTELLEGSFTDCLVQTIKFPTYNYELIYYNSLSYFLGSGGGEVFSYIVDFDKEVTHYAHLFTDSENKVSLFISDDSEEVIKNFFVSNFKRDYPSLQLVSNDVDLEI